MATAKGQRRAQEPNGAHQAFLRGDFRAVRRVAPEFVAPLADGTEAALPLFARGKLVPRIAWASASLLVAAWIYALSQR